MNTLARLARDTQHSGFSQAVPKEEYSEKGGTRSWLCAMAVVFLLSLVSSALAQAQSDPFVGTWKLDTAKSTPVRKTETRIVESSPTGLKVSVDRTNADGTNQQISYTANLDGKPYPFVGSAPYGADSVGVTLGSSNTLTYKLWRGGKVVASGSFVVSPDGKTGTLKSSGADEKGVKQSSVSIYTKQ